MRVPFFLFLVAALSGCIVDNLALTTALDEDHEVPPPAPNTLLRGSLGEPYAGGNLSFWNASGGALTPLQSSVTDGRYEARFSGTEAIGALRVSATDGARVGFVLVPSIPRAISVTSPPTVIDLAQLAPVMATMSDETTTMTLALEYKARQERGGLGTLSQPEILDAFAQMDVAILADGPLNTLRQAVSLLLAASDTATGAPAVFTSPDLLADVGSSLNPEFLRAAGVDYDQDGVDDTSTEAFERMLAEAAATIELAPPCYDPNLVSVVFQLDMNGDGQDLNCETVDPFKWVLPDPGDLPFITGSVHPDQASCVDQPEVPTCALPETVAAVNEELGNFAPNLVQLYDDASHGDTVAGDGIYSISFVLPRGLQIHYKYTYARGGEGWTATEEWPGNSRLLTLLDVNGDGVVVRRDLFGDETTNKDRANALSPSRGGRGTIDYESDANGDGLADAGENMIDTDGDCVADAWPSPGPVAPALADPEVCKE